MSLQPFDRRFGSKNEQTGEDYGDLALITKFAEMAAKKSSDVQIYILARCPRITSGGMDPHRSLFPSGMSWPNSIRKRAGKVPG